MARRRFFLDTIKVGKTIAYLRKRRGYTQKELADRIGVSDKAVSKWERGLGLPDIGLIGKIAIVLDSNADSLLAGDIIYHSSGWIGLLILEENLYGINAGTIIYDKPLISFQLSYFMLMGIREIQLVSDEKEQKVIKELFGDGSRIGLKLTYLENIPLELYAQSKANIMIVAGRNFIYGVDQTRFFQKAMLDKERITVLSLPKKQLDLSSGIYFDSDKKVVNAEYGDKINTQYKYYQIPILFCPADKITKIDFALMQEDGGVQPAIINEEIYTVTLDRGFVEIPINTWDDVIDTSLFVKTVQKACGMQIYCVEEIAWRRGMISLEELYMLGENRKQTPYGKYILDIAKEFK